MTQQAKKYLDKIALCAFHRLMERGPMGRFALLELIEQDNKALVDSIPAEAKKPHPKTQRAKWMVRLSRRSTWFVRVGWLRKEGGVWHITEKGMEAAKRGADYIGGEITKAREVRRNARRGARASAAPQNEDVGDDADGNEDAAIEEEEKSKSLDSEEDDARQDIDGYIRKMGWRKFQDLCAALLRGMGYYVRDVAPPGPDGGVDVLAYADPIGARPPRIKLQAKHSQTEGGNKPSLKVVTKLENLLVEGDVGIVVVTSSFSPEIRDHARKSAKQIELVDLTRFISLWREHYNKLSEKDKALLPLRPIYFLDKKKVSEKVSD